MTITTPTTTTSGTTSTTADADPASTLDPSTTSIPAPVGVAGNGHMRGQLEPRSEAGRRLAAAVDGLAATFAERSRRRDADGESPADSLDDLRAIGYLRAAIPTYLGGLGVEAAHDLAVVASRLARADASLAIGVNMHTVAAHSTVQAWRFAVESGGHDRAVRLGGTVRMIAESGVAMAAAVSEPSGGQDLSRPSTTATREGDGWRIDGTKAFCTMSPLADVLGVAVTFVDGDGAERYGFAQVSTTAAGCTVHDDWDALGMRSSGSGRVSFDGVRIARHELSDSHPAGETSAAGLDRFLTSGLFHASATLGIAEEAHRQVTDVDAAGRGRLAERGRSMQLVADDVVDLAAMRATLARAATAADEHFRSALRFDGRTVEASADVFAQVQAAKALIDQVGPRVVDRALELSGGAGYLTRSPLSQAYRDVRAGAFMHPLGANRAYDFIAHVELGLSPSIR